MSYRGRISILIVIDIIFVWFSIVGSYLLRYDGQIPPDVMPQFIAYIITSALFCTTSMYYFKLYNRVWQYASVGEIISILKAVVLGCLASYVLTGIISDNSVPMSIFLRTFETILLLLGGSRFVWRVFRDNWFAKKKVVRKALIIGAGACGSMIAKELFQSPNAKVVPAAFIDDDETKIRMHVHGVPVVGNRSSITYAVSRFEIDDIIIAIPSAPKKELSKIIEICKGTKAKLKMIPNISDFVHGKVSVKEIREVDVEDLLGRDAIKVDLEGIANYVEDKIVLVTGAGGSIGSELCRQIARFQPGKLLLLGHGENSIYTIEMELRDKFPDLALETIIADVQDRSRISDVFQTYAPQVVFHAAAHKHVPLMERNPSEAIKNNVFGTKNVAECSDEFGVERFVLISTDKAVNPTSIMGATKRIAEMLIQALDKRSETKFVAVRFGNVLGSRGSVIPHFKKQIARGGPVTVTHPDMIRYFMTIPEASQLVIQAGAFAKGGEIFILDMGEPVKIVDLATDLIRLSGFEPGVDIDIEFSGIRPGEKLYEEILTSEEGTTSTKHDRIFVGKPSAIDGEELELEIQHLEKVLGSEQVLIRQMIKQLVPTFQKIS